MATDISGTETIWVKDATASDKEKNNEDILITVVDGYVYQVYYDSTYGALFTEYVGKDDGKGFPNLKTEYEKGKITGTASAEEGKSIKSVELIYKGEVKESSTESNISFDVGSLEGGWYIVKVTSTSRENKI